MSTIEQLYCMVGKDENILWSGRPQFKPFILETIFQPLLLLALPIGLLYSVFVLYPLITHWNLLFLFWGLFFTLFTEPVWIYLYRIFSSFFKYKNTAFIVTDKGVYISSGVFSLNFNHKPFMEISRVNLHCGIIDRMLGVGDVVFGTAVNLPNAPTAVNNLVSNQLGGNLSIYDIPDYQEVYSMVKELQQNIYADVQYPNDLRPNQNHGYNTAYVPPESKQ